MRYRYLPQKLAFFGIVLFLIYSYFCVPKIIEQLINKPQNIVQKEVERTREFTYIMETTYESGEQYLYEPAIRKKFNPVDISLNYILQWTSPNSAAFFYMGEGQEVFKKNRCKYTNCFVTSDRNYLSDVTKFDVIAFNCYEVATKKLQHLPDKRSPYQKYAFVSLESSHICPICNRIYDKFFNLTWTFRLDSDIRWGYFVVKDKSGNVIGPDKDMHWMKRDDMQPVPSEILSVLKGKTKAVAWFVSICDTYSKREEFVHNLTKELDNYKINIDIYGDCGPLTCRLEENEKCDKLIEKDYFFYLAFENSFNNDYVTESVLHGLQHSTIPIVYGTANYTRFLPDGSYLNAKDLGVQKLAAEIQRLMNNLTEYSEYFKWKNHYTYSEDTRYFCDICASLNDKKTVKNTFVYNNFREWWNLPNDTRCNLRLQD